MSTADEIIPVVGDAGFDSEEEELGPLPDGWEKRYDETAKKWFFLAHGTCCTTWVDPRHHLAKPHTFACLPEDTDELPYGWEAGKSCTQFVMLVIVYLFPISIHAVYVDSNGKW